MATSESRSTSAAFQSLPLELLSKVLALTGRPAAFATVCRSWNSVLHKNSISNGISSSSSSSGDGDGLWNHVDLYCRKKGAPCVPQHGSHLCGWLQKRAKLVQSLTFHRFTDHQVFMSTALGLLSFAPLRRLQFDDCRVDAGLLVILQTMTDITHLRLGRLTNWDSESTAPMLDTTLASLPMLADLELRFLGGSHYSVAFDKWPDAITACTNLTRLTVEGFRMLPNNIGNLVNLHALRVYGNGVKCLPPSVGQLTKLTSLTNSFASREGYTRAGFCTIIPPEAAGMTALQQLSLITKDLPANLSGLAALTSLSIGDLAPWQQTTAKQLEAAVASMRGLCQLRLHHCSPKPGGMVGLRDILARVPNLTALRLDGNGMPSLESGDLGPFASSLRVLDLVGSRFKTVPRELERASGCRFLAISLLPSRTRREFGSRAALLGSPLLAMPQLRELRLAQTAWACEDIEAMLQLRQVFDARRAINGQAVAIRCPRLRRDASYVRDLDDMLDGRLERALHQPTPNADNDENDDYDAFPVEDTGFDPYEIDFGEAILLSGSNGSVDGHC